MAAPAFFTDEDVYAAIAPALRKAGLDALSSAEAGGRNTWTTGEPPADCPILRPSAKIRGCTNKTLGGAEECPRSIGSERRR